MSLQVKDVSENTERIKSISQSMGKTYLPLPLKSFLKWIQYPQVFLYFIL